MGGIITLLPVIVLLFVAVKTKRTASSLIIAVILAYIIKDGPEFIWTMIDGFYDVAMDEDLIWMILIMVFIGCLIGLLTVMGATEALITVITKRINSQRSLFLYSWLLIVLLFIDDAVRTIVLGQLSPLYDKYGVPRATLTYLADGTGPCIATLIPVTDWAAFFMGIFAGYYALSDTEIFSMYVGAIPFMFYGWASIIIVFGFTMGWIPKLGAMKKTYAHFEKTGELYSERSRRFNEMKTVEMDEDGNFISSIQKPVPRIVCFVVTFVILTAVVIIWHDLLIGLVIANLILAIWALVARFAKWGSILSSALEGAASMTTINIIIFSAITLRTVLTDLGMPDFIISVAEPFVSPALFPVISFLAVCLLTFTTGSNWGVTAVYATIGAPLGIAIGAHPALLMAAIINGATFGSHICFYCDYTVFASQLTKIDNMEHALTQLPYGLIGAGISVVLFAAFGIMLT